MGTITLNEKQRRRCEIITRLIAHKISSSEASELLGRSSRQVRRIRQRYEAQGLETLVHGNQGRSNHQSYRRRSNGRARVHLRDRPLAVQVYGSE